MISAAELAGLARSLAIYYGNPVKTARLRRFYAGIVGPGDLAFDIGAHVGSRTRVLSGLGARVVALEPQPLFAAFLARTLPRGATLVREAVAARPGRVRLAVSSLHPTVSTLSREWIGTVAPTDGFRRVRWDRTVEVEATTLDRLVAAHGLPRFVKIDVEGMEAEILAGLSAAVPVVAVEYVPAARGVAVAAVERLAALGDYRFERVVGETHRFSGRWMEAGETRRMLEGLSAGERSGDLYAVLAGEIDGAGLRRATAASPGSPAAATTSP